MGQSYRNKFKNPKTGNLEENPVYWLRYSKMGKTVRESARTKNRAAALKKLHKRQGDVARGIPVSASADRIKFYEVTELITRDYKLNKLRSIEDLKARLRLHVLPFFGDALAASIIPGDIEEYKMERKEEGAANGTINRELAVIKRVFKLARIQGKLTHAPHISMLCEKNAIRKGFFRTDLFIAVKGKLAAMKDRFPRVLSALATFYFFTGWRLSEAVGIDRRGIVGLMWKEIDFAAGMITLLDSKNSDGREFPIIPELLEMLQEMREYTDRVQREQGKIIPWVFHRDGEPVKGFYKAWVEACKLAGCPGALVHDFRRTAVRNLSAVPGISQATAMALTGHKTASVSRRYAIVDRTDLKNAGKALSESFSKVLARSADLPKVVNS